MNQDLYNEQVKRSVKAEILFVNYMTDSGYEFLAGDLNRKTINSDYLEECFPCEFIPSGNNRGARLLFRDSQDNTEKVFIMPDALLKFKKTGKVSWFDVKNKTPETLREPLYKMIDYWNVSHRTGTDCFIAIVIWNCREKGFDIYVSDVDKYIFQDDLNRFVKKDEYVYFDLRDFQKVNRRAVPPIED
jgi:hypothetical protein